MREPVPMDMRVRSLLGSVCWSLAKSWISLIGSVSFLSTSSTPTPPGMIKTSYSFRSSWASSNLMSALTVRPEDEVTPGEPAAIVHSKAFDSTDKVHQW